MYQSLFYEILDASLSNHQIYTDASITNSPGYCGIYGNAKVDKAVLESVNNPSTEMLVYLLTSTGILIPIVSICGNLNGGVHQITN